MTHRTRHLVRPGTAIVAIAVSLAAFASAETTPVATGGGGGTPATGSVAIPPALTPYTVESGQSVELTVAVEPQARTRQVLVQASSAVVTVPTTPIPITAGAGSFRIPLVVRRVTAATNVTLTIQLTSSRRDAAAKALPPIVVRVVPQVSIAGFTVRPDPIGWGNPGVATLRLDALTGKRTFQLTSTSSSVRVPPSVTLMNASETSIPITTQRPALQRGQALPTTVTLTATRVDPVLSATPTRATATFTVRPLSLVPCGEATTLDDFEDGDFNVCPNGDRHGAWSLNPDSAIVAIGPATKALRVKRFGWITALVRTSGGAAVDLGPYTGVRLRVRAVSVPASTTVSVTVAVPTDETLAADRGGRCVPSAAQGCDDFHQASVTSLTTKWKTVDIPFPSLQQSGSGVAATFDRHHVRGVALMENSVFGACYDDPSAPDGRFCIYLPSVVGVEVDKISVY
jgi:hypothetical protein